MKDYSNFLTEKPYSCSVEGCSMKFTNEDHLTVHKKRHDMILNLGLGQKGTTVSDQTPTPTQFIRNCEEVGLFQDLQNVNPFEETFQKAIEAIKSGQLSLEKSLQASPHDDTLHTPNIFPHITDMPNVNHSETYNKSENIPPCEDELLKQGVCDNVKNNLRDITSGHNISQPILSQGKKENTLPLSNVNSVKNNSAENKVMLNVPEGHVLQLLPPEDSQNSCNMVVLKNMIGDGFSPVTLAVKQKLKKNINEKKTGKNLPHKVPILKCPVKRLSNYNENKFSKFSENAKKLISKLEVPNVAKGNESTNPKQKKINKIQSKESRSEFLARSRAASSRCREKKKMYLLYLEKVNSELSTANQNLVLINSLLRQEIRDLRRELIKHRNCSAAVKKTEVAPTAATDANLSSTKAPSEKEQSHKIPPSCHSNAEIKQHVVEPKKKELFQSNELISLDSSACQSDPSFCFDVAEVILNSEPEENEIPLSEGNKPPDIIVRFNSISNDFPATLPSDSCIDRYIEGAGESVKQIYGEHSYYLKTPSADIDKRIMNYKTFRSDVETQIASECRNLSALKIKIQQNDSLRDLTSLNSKVLLGPRTPPPLILLKPFKKRSLQSKRNEKHDNLFFID